MQMEGFLYATSISTILKCEEILGDDICTFPNILENKVVRSNQLHYI